MTFILEDKQLVDTLLRYAQAAQPQRYMAVSPEDVNVVRGLIGDLEQKLSGEAVAVEPEITTGSEQNAALSSSNMKNLSTLVNWLGMNGIKVNGKNVVVGWDDLPNDPSYVAYQFEGDQTFRPSNQLVFKVNKELLAQYLNSLRSQLSKLPNPVMQAQVDGLVREANEQLGTGVGKDHPEVKQTPDSKSSGNASPNQPGPSGAPQAATLQQLADILPLQRDVLDFGRVRDFINHYRSLVGASTDPNRAQQANVAMDQAEQFMQAATKNTLGQSMTTFHMDGLSANDLKEWSTPPDPGQAARTRGSARALADYLEQVVRQVYVIVKDLYNSHYQQLRDPRLSDLNLAIQQQVGGPSIPFGSSLASSNMDDIQTARARLPQVGA